MPYFLRFDGTTNEQGDLSSNTTNTETNWRIEFMFANRELVGNYNVINRIFSNLTNFSSSIFTNKLFDRDTVSVRTQGITHGELFYSSNPPLQDDNLPHIIQINYDGTTISGTIDGNPFDNTITASNVRFNGFGRICDSCLFDFYYFRYWSDNTGTNLVYDWNADSSQSNGSGSILYDDASANNATLQNMEPEDWVFYGSAGVSISVDNALNYTSTFNNVSLVNDRQLAVDTQSYSYTLNNVNLTYQQLNNFFIDVTTQSYSYNLSPVDLIYDRQLNIVGQAYNYTLNDVNLTYQAIGAFSIDVNTQSYNYTLNDVSLLVDKSLNVIGQIHSYTLNNIPVALSKIITVDSQSYSATFNDINLVKVGAISINLDTANYVVTYNEIGLTYSGFISVVLTDYNMNYNKEQYDITYANPSYNIRYEG